MVSLFLLLVGVFKRRLQQFHFNSLHTLGIRQKNHRIWLFPGSPAVHSKEVLVLAVQVLDVSTVAASFWMCVGQDMLTFVIKPGSEVAHHWDPEINFQLELSHQLAVLVFQMERLSVKITGPKRAWLGEQGHYGGNH